MALEDVVQGVQVTVKTDGVDDAKGQIGELDKAIGSLAKTAESAAGGGGPGGGGNAGLGGLNKAFSDLNTVSAQAFAQIAKSAATGDFTGLATMVGGPVVGAFVQGAESIGEFVKSQDSAILKTAAMAREFGTTSGVMAGIQEGFEGAGVSAGGFERLVNRMSRQVQNDYAEMTRNIRTDSDSAEGATLRLQAAQEKLAISKGADPASFQYQDKIRQQKFDQIAVDQAEEAVRQQALKSIPHVTDLLKESAETGRMNADITEVSTKTLRESIENMARVGQGPASPIDVLKKEAELIKSGAIDIDTAIKLLKDQGGMSRGAGLGGMDAVHEAEYLKKYGASGITAAQAGQTAVQQANLGQTEADTLKATQTIAEWSKFTGLFNAMMKTTAAQMSGSDSWTNTILKIGEDAIKWSARLNQATNAAKPKEGETLGWMERADRFWNAYLNPPPPKPEKLDAQGKPIDQSQPTRENVGTGPAQMIHIPEGWTGSPPVKEVKRTSVGSGPGVMIDIPENLGMPKGQHPAPGKPGELEKVEGPNWMSVLPNNPTQADIDKFNAAKEPSYVPAGSIPAHMGLDRPEDYAHLSRARAGFPPGDELPPKATDEQIKRWGTPPAAAAAPEKPSEKPFTDFIQGLRYNVTAGSSGTYNPKTDFIGSGPREAPAAAPAPAAPPVTVNVSVTAPVSVSVGAAGATATPGTGTATTTAGHAGGGLISIPGFAIGGNVAGSYDTSGLMQSDSARGFADGGFIPGFAGGGLSGETDDPIEHAEIIVADAELEVARNPGASGPKERLALAKNALAKVQAEAHREERDRKVWQEGQGQRDQANEYSRKLNAAEKKFREEPGDHGVFHREEYGLWGGGSIPGFATGSIKGPGTGTSDSILARLSNGEFVMKDAAVRTYGTGFMHAINNMQIPPPKYAGGGMVPVSSLPRFAAEGGMERPGSTLNLHVGGEVFKGLKAPAAVADQLRKFAIDQQTSQTGKKPSWAGG